MKANKKPSLFRTPRTAQTKGGDYTFKQHDDFIKQYYLVVDLEATCWNNNSKAATQSKKSKNSKKHSKHKSHVTETAAASLSTTSKREREREIIEIGAVVIDAQSDTFDIVREFNIFVRPSIHPQLSDFCTELTTITQENVDAAPTFKAAFKQFTDFLYETGEYCTYKFCAWGNFDADMIATECKRINRTSPFSDTLNLKVKLLNQYNFTNAHAGNLDKACQALGHSWEGAHHRAIVDAQNTAKLMQIMLVHHRENNSEHTQSQYDSAGRL